MRSVKIILACAVAAIVVTGGIYLVRRRVVSGTGANSATRMQPSAQGNAPGTGMEGANGDIALTTTNFIGKLAPGGTAEAAGHERNYVVTYQVAFVRKNPGEKLPEESLTYQQLMEKDPGQFPPYVYYGEIVRGTYDPVHPDAIAVRATIDKKEVRGYIDAQKLWLEPEIASVETPRYMARKDDTAIHVVPDEGSPTVLSILQGEVVDVAGKVNFQGAWWIKARYNMEERPRFGFIPENDLLALAPARINPSVVAADEIPHGIRNSDISLTDADRQRLSEKGFYIEAVPPEKFIGVDDMVAAYGNSRHGRQYFITSDLFLHAHHLIFDRMLQDVEEKKLSPVMARLSENLAKASENELGAAPSSSPADLREALTFNVLYFSIAAKLFNPGFAIPSVVKGDAESYVSSIQEAGSKLPTSLTSKFGDEDFTQYKPRGHYEKNETLQRYFRAMMWYGRRNFLLADKKMTLAAILLPGVVEKAGGTRAYEALDRALGYLVGPQDKYTLGGYRSINKKIFETETPDISQVAAKLEENEQAFVRAVESELPAPQIVSVQTGLGKTQEERLKMVRGFKFLGQRYTLDAFFFNQLTSPSVGSDNHPRNLPSALDVMMLLGSKAATEQQQQVQQQQNWANYESQEKSLENVAQEHLSKPSSFYEAWLGILNSLFTPAGSKQLFTLGKPWEYKNLNAGGASWTELKHDTILYAEQSEAEMGEGGEFSIPPYNPPEPKGYIEPNPLFFNRQGQSIDQMLERLKQSDFIPDEYVDKFTTLRELARAAGDIAQREISGAAISAEDYRWIENLERNFGPELLLPRGYDVSMIKDPDDLKMALIADVATDAVAGRVLEVGTGVPQRITVVVKDAYGGTRLTVGYVYSWYEFASPKRWADTEWKKVIYSEDSTAKKQNGIEPPSWYSMFLKN